MYTYLITMPDGSERRFEVDPDRPAAVPGDDAPAWAAMSFCRCPHCPLSERDHPACPAALDLVEIVDAFADDLSIDHVQARVISGQREYLGRGDLQGVLRSLVGLVMASSACPILARLKGPARFHLPFSDRGETLFRVAGAYLIQQYFVSRDGGEPDQTLDGLRAIYDDIAQLNVAFAMRLRAAVRRDANVNALAALFSLGSLVSFSLDEDLQELRGVLGPDQGSDST